jgi:2,5-diketo-D-gluconate reductase B
LALARSACRAAAASLSSKSALALGYRHLDTAAMYENQDAVGAAIAALPKDQRYVTPPFAPDWNALTL